MFDMIKVEVNCDADILGRVKPRSYVPDVVGKKVREQLPLVADLCCRGRRRRDRYFISNGAVAYNKSSASFTAVSGRGNNRE